LSGTSVVFAVGLFRALAAPTVGPRTAFGIWGSGIEFEDAVQRKVLNTPPRRLFDEKPVTSDELSNPERRRPRSASPPRSVLDDLDEEMRKFENRSEGGNGSGLRGHEAALAETIAKRAAADARRRRGENSP
jgi:hypothetical protein